MPPQPVKAAAPTVAALIADYDRELARLGHRDRPRVIGFIRDFWRWGAWTSAEQVGPQQVFEFLAAGRAGEVKRGTAKPTRWGAKTHNNAVGKLQTFWAWLCATGRAWDNPVKDVDLLPQTDSDDEGSRHFTPEEALSIINIAEWSMKYNKRGKSSNRADVYRVMWLTGLRYKECRQLRVKDIRFAAPGQPAHLKLPAKTVKAGKWQRVELAPEAVVVFSRLAAGKQPDDKVFTTMPTWGSLKFDVEKAGVSVAGAGFHSFRKGLITQLAVRGVHPKIAQQIARHSDIDTTMRVYTCINGQLTEALAGIGLVKNPSQSVSNGVEMAVGIADTVGTTVNTKAPSAPEHTQTAGQTRAREGETVVGFTALSGSDRLFVRSEDRSPGPIAKGSPNQVPEEGVEPTSRLVRALLEALDQVPAETRHSVIGALLKGAFGEEANRRRTLGPDDVPRGDGA